MKIKKRNGRMLIVSLVVFVLLILSGLDVYANPRAMDAPTLVSPQPDGEDAEDTDSGYLDIGYVSHSIYDGSSILAVNAQLGGAATDSSYDLRSLDQVTPVRNQYSGGTCWAFAAICSAESSALKEGLKSSNMSTDLSELQIAYFMYHTVSDPLGNFGTDGVYFGDGQDYEYFDFGGNDIYVSMALAKWTGVTEELSAMPYPATYGVDPNSDYDNQYAYSKDALHLENALWIDIGDKEAIQSNIVNYGAATISFFYSSTYLNTAVGKKGAYYYNGTTYGTNSAYTVRIFKLNGGDVDPTDGSLVGTVPGVQMYEGYHTVNLDSEIELMAGDRFSVVIDLIASPGAYAYVFVDVADTLFGTDYPYSNATCNTGESYLSEDGVTWEESDYNCRIKAFTVNDEAINVVVNNPANSHLFRVEGSGNEIQNNLSNKMTDIVYVAESGYYIPTAYSVPSQNGVTVTRNSDSQITVSGTPSASATIDLIGIISSSEQSSPSGVVYRTHVENVGWQDYVANGTTSGTLGQGLRLEGINVSLNSSIDGGVRYRTHVQNIGWQDWVTDGALSGTSGQGLRLEAVQISLTGLVANYYDIYYRVQAQDYGWLGWTKNGASGGTAGQGKRLEAIQIMIVVKGEVGPNPQYYSYVEYAKIASNANNLGRVNYFTHVQNYGNQSYVYDGSVAGTFGEGLRLEAMKIELTGDMATYYDIYYRVHAQDFGWLGWAKNGEMSGTSGYGKRLEALQVVVVPKGDAPPGDTANPSIIQ